MARPPSPQFASKTDTSPTARSSNEAEAPKSSPALAVVLEADRLSAGPFVVPLGGIARIVITRGSDRTLQKDSDGLVLTLPDRRISRPHATIERERETGAFLLTDLGSSNGTFAGAFGKSLPVTRERLSFEQPFRVGHSLFALIKDGGPAVRRAGMSAPWPFATLSAPFARELDRLERLAASAVPLLLLGETGTGKEVLARAIHQRSLRPGPFVAVNCGALPANLVESHLFGHLKGAFSGALRDEPGFVRAAQHGTLLLDEVGDLPLLAQVSLLRVLQEGEVTPVGAFQPVKVDVRVLSATHQPLAERVAAGTFRADLLGRLSGFSFQIPALRERPFDIGEILSVLARAGGPESIHPDAALALLAHSYPMNIRELKQAINAAAVLAEQGTIQVSDLPLSFREPPPENEQSPPEGDELALRDELDARLRATGYNLTQVARDMGRARQQIQRWIKRFGLRRPIGTTMK